MFNNNSKQHTVFIPFLNIKYYFCHHVPCAQMTILDTQVYTVQGGSLSVCLSVCLPG